VRRSTADHRLGTALPRLVRDTFQSPHHDQRREDLNARVERKSGERDRTCHRRGVEQEADLADVPSQGRVLQPKAAPEQDSTVHDR
jgi:hypothetical protein